MGRQVHLISTARLRKVCCLPTMIGCCPSAGAPRITPAVERQLEKICQRHEQLLEVGCWGGQAIRRARFCDRGARPGGRG